MAALRELGSGEERRVVAEAGAGKEVPGCNTHFVRKV